MDKLTIKDLDLRGKRVFIRVDFNVPLKEGVVTDDTRIRETLPTLKLAIERGGRLVLASHLGRPKGKVDPKYSLAPVAKRLRELLGGSVEFASDCVGAETEAKSRAAHKPAAVALTVALTGILTLLDNLHRRSLWASVLGAVARSLRPV